MISCPRPMPLPFGARDTPMIHAGAGRRRGVASGSRSRICSEAPVFASLNLNRFAKDV
jgi:hypothetical protein